LLDEFLVNCYHLLEKSNFVDIHIDFCEDTITDGILEKIKPSKITYSIVENRGMDVIPFVKTLYDKVLFTDTYSVVTKIQSKKSYDDWRVHAYKPLVDDYEKFLNMNPNGEDGNLENVSINKIMVDRGVLGLQPFDSIALHMQSELEKDLYIDWEKRWNSVEKI
jgi:hypothetical protein